MNQINPRERIALKLISTFLLFFWGAVGFYLLSSAVPDSPVLPPRILREVQFAHMPQGWAFFTRSAREPELTVFRPTESGWSAVTMRNASWETFFGLRKGGALNGIELGAIVKQVRDWDQAKIAWEPRLPRYPELVEASQVAVQNLTTIKMICGEFLLVKQKPVPWAWARSGAPVKLAATFKKVSVECE